jgi:hypothetical protein
VDYAEIGTPKRIGKVEDLPLKAGLVEIKALNCLKPSPFSAVVRSLASYLGLVARY